jgi:hypothetical protein
MSGDTAFDEINEAKANMDGIYDQRDPRAYFRELRMLGYAIPSSAKPTFQKLIGNLQFRQENPVHVLDIGCSYGVNAALLKYDLTMAELYDHWCDRSLIGATYEDVIAHDQRFMDSLDYHTDISVTGLDLAESAISFAEDSGLLDEGLALNLETEALPEDAKENLAGVDLVMSTGCVGYVTEKSFERLLPAVTKRKSPWMGNFVLRMFPFDVIEKTLNDWGYVTEKLEGRTFLQRNFASAIEQEQVLEQLCDQNIDPTGKEADGQLLAEFYLSRPAKNVAYMPIDQLLQV